MPKYPDRNIDRLDKRVLVHRSSVKKLFALMIKSVQTPQKAPPELIAACRTQSTFAKFSSSSYKIMPISLNTLKSLANLEEQSGGWFRLNELRVKLKESFPLRDRSKQLAESKKSQLRAELDSLKSQLIAAHRVRAVIYSAYADILAIASEQAKANQHLASKLLHHQQTYRDCFGMRIVDSSPD